MLVVVGLLICIVVAVTLLLVRKVGQPNTSLGRQKLLSPHTITQESPLEQGPHREGLHRSAAARAQLPAELPSVIAFVDIETTGLRSHDRIVSVAVVLLKKEDVEVGRVNLSVLHRIYNPGMKCHPQAEKVHGHSDWLLRHQPFFIEEAAEISEFIGRGGLVCCHNAAFDLAFVARELEHAGVPPLKAPSFCTMNEYRRRYSGSASLGNLASQLNLKRAGDRHSALEDVLLTINVFFALQKLPIQIPIEALGEDRHIFQNARAVPTVPSGPLPSRKRRPKGRS